MALDGSRSWDVPRVAGAVLRGQTVVETVGDTDAPFPLASVTKVLTAVAVLIAAEEGIIELDEPAGPPGSTVRHLLAHASGLGPEGDEVLAPPASRRIYSNGGFERLGELVADRASMAFPTYWHEAMAGPLGLSSTSLVGSPAHGATSSVDDLTAILVACLSGALLSADSQQALSTQQCPSLNGVLPGFGRQDPNPWGLGVEIKGHKSPHWTSARNSPATWGHFGRSGTFVWVDPVHDIATIVLTNREFGPWAAAAWPALADNILAEYA